MPSSRRHGSFTENRITITSAPDPVVRFPPQLLIDLLNVGSGYGPNFARRFSQMPGNLVVDFCNGAIANAYHGEHWLGPRALNELLTIASDVEEDPVNRQNALGALARAIRARRGSRDHLADIASDRQPERIIRLATYLLLIEDREHPGWTTDPALTEVQCLPADYSGTPPKLPGP